MLEKNRKLSEVASIAGYAVRGKPFSTRAKSRNKTTSYVGETTGTPTLGGGISVPTADGNSSAGFDPSDARAVNDLAVRQTGTKRQFSAMREDSGVQEQSSALREGRKSRVLQAIQELFYQQLGASLKKAP